MVVIVVVVVVRCGWLVLLLIGVVVGCCCWRESIWKVFTGIVIYSADVLYEFVVIGKAFETENGWRICLDSICDRVGALGCIRTVRTYALIISSGNGNLEGCCFCVLLCELCFLYVLSLYIWYRCPPFLISVSWLLYKVSVLNQRLPIYGIHVMHTRIEHVVPCYRLHFWLSIWILNVTVESMAIT